MTNKVLEAVEERSEEISATAQSNEKLGRLDDSCVQILTDVGVMRMLQPKKYGGMEVHPAEFAETVMRIARADGSAGWVAGIVGVHPWEMAMADPQVAEEVWGEDPDTWIASPYAPMGILTPVEGGYRFTGHWQFSSGTDHCQWIFLGAFLGDENGGRLNPPVSMHVILPRSDYEIVDDSWDVVGLRGTGSKDVIVNNAFVPDYRVIPVGPLMNGDRPHEMGLTNPLYQVPFTVAFPLGITSAVVGMAEGVLAHHLAYQRSRTQVTGIKVTQDPVLLNVIGEASAEIDASRVALLDNINRFYDQAEKGERATFAERARNRRNQVAAAWRAVRAADEVVARSGGNAMRMDQPMQRFWRDMHMGMVHAIHVPAAVMQVSALTQMDAEVPQGPIRSMI